MESELLINLTWKSNAVDGYSNLVFWEVGDWFDRLTPITRPEVFRGKGVYCNIKFGRSG